MILEKIKWQEFHENGQLWIDGEIGIVGEIWKHLYDYRTGFEKHEGKPVVRLGKWKKYYDNGQLAWTLDYGDGTYDCIKEKFPQYRHDGTII